MRNSKAWGQLSAAGLVLAFGIAFAYEGRRYEFGSADNMGPGYFPIVTGIVLALFGGVLIVEALTSPEESDNLHFREPFFVLVAMVSFALLLESFGFFAAVFALVIVSAYAEGRRSIPEVLGLAAILTATGYIIFILGFNIPVDLWEV